MNTAKTFVVASKHLIFGALLTVQCIASTSAQSKDDLLFFKDVLERGYELKTVIKQPPSNPRDPSDGGSEHFFVQKGASLLVCIGAIVRPTEQQPQPKRIRALCAVPLYLRD